MDARDHAAFPLHPALLVAGGELLVRDLLGPRRPPRIRMRASPVGVHVGPGQVSGSRLRRLGRADETAVHAGPGDEELLVIEDLEQQSIAVGRAGQGICGTLAHAPSLGTTLAAGVDRLVVLANVGLAIAGDCASVSEPPSRGGIRRPDGAGAQPPSKVRRSGHHFPTARCGGCDRISRAAKNAATSTPIDKSHPT